MNAQERIHAARTLVGGDKGLLAVDESNPTCNKRFASLGIPQTEEAHVLAAQQALNHRARCNRAVHRGEYNAAIDKNMSMTTSTPKLTKPAA